MICFEVLGELFILCLLVEIIGGDGFDVWVNIVYVYMDNGEDVIEVFKVGV